MNDITHTYTYILLQHTKAPEFIRLLFNELWKL